MRKSFRLRALILCAWLVTFSVTLMVSCHSSQSEDASNPNIVLILADDMGYGDVTSYNPDSKIPTPNIDRLASQGIQFMNAHSPASLCTPSRYGLLTGRYCWRTRLKMWVILGYDEAPLIESDRPTLATLLKQKGYHTAAIGKWHLGMNWQTKDDYVIQDDLNDWQSDSSAYIENEIHIDFSKPVTGGPLELGFDYFFGTLGCSTSDPPYVYIENDHTVGIPTAMSPDSFLRLPGFAPGLMISGFSLENVDIDFTNKAIGFISDHVSDNRDEPFFIYLALSSPHNPFLPPDFAKGKSLEGPRGDLVTVVDWSLGQIMETLQKYRLEENTLVILTSDNGAMKGANGHKSQGNYRGYKASIWDGGHRVPFIVRWPGRIQSGSVSHEVISLSDMFATFSALVSADPFTKGGEDSYNVLPAFFGKSLENANETVRVFHSGGGFFAVQKGQWKLIEGTKGAGSGKEQYVEGMIQPGQLYNILDDPFEKNDLWDQEPEVVNSMMKLLNQCRSSPASNNLR